MLLKATCLYKVRILGLCNEYEVCANHCAKLGMHAEVRIPNLRCAILGLRRFHVSTEHIQLQAFMSANRVEIPWTRYLYPLLHPSIYRYEHQWK